jgi:hypothetical protein
VKYTGDRQGNYNLVVEDTIQNGVKHTEYGDWEDGDERLDDIIQNGVKETHSGCNLLINDSIEDAIQNGVKKTNWRKVDNHPTFTDNVIERGEKC